MNARLIPIFLAAMFPWFTAYCQHHNFRNFSSEHGFPESPVTSLYEDRRGYLWIATSGAGLMRYDGYEFYAIAQEDGLKTHFIYSIHEDRAGKLWFGTDTGIYIYDGVKFSPFKFLADQRITAIAQDAANNYWFGTAETGLYKYDGKSLMPFKTTHKGIGDAKINCLYVDKNDALWIGTPNGMARLAKQEFTLYTTSSGLPSNVIHGITQNGTNILWIATAEGAARLENGNFTTYTARNGMRTNNVTAVLADQKGNVWFGTATGVAKFDGKNFRHYDPHTGQTATAVTCLYQDSQGNLWLGSSEKGLSRLDSERFIHYPENDQMGKRVYSIIQAINGNIICGTSLGGTTVFDGRQYTLLDKREGFTSSIVQAFYYDPDSTLWVGTQDDGVYRFRKGGYFHYTTDEGLISNNVTGFVTDRQKNLWVSTADSGIAVIRIINDSLRVGARHNESTGMPSNKISAIAFHNGDVWVGTENNGIARLTSRDGVTASVKHVDLDDGLSSLATNTIAVDSAAVYCGTSKGITIYNGNRFLKISKSDGLTSNNIYSLTLDGHDNLWAGTDRGVDLITFENNFATFTIRHFDSDEGFKGLEVYRNASCTDRDGNLWFGTINGLVKYNPSEEVKTRLAPSVHITGINLFFTPVEETNYVDSIAAWQRLPVNLVLPYDQNTLTFQFTGVHLRNPEAVRYKWMLEGSGHDWSPPASDRSVTISNISPGDYTFKVLACNEYNIWTETPATFTFTIAPPIWQRWWARGIAFAALVSLIWLFFHFRLQRIKAKNRNIQERLEMEKSVLELEQEAARLQMNPHFIFNCLNSIQGFISTNDAFQAKKYLARFAKLMRLILENAREEFIPLANEVNILENYLELEQLTTKKFEFNIRTDEGIDPDSVYIPPMLIQPFVENAIIHGLKRKEGPGIIDINFHVRGELLVCEITDNGIGRKKSAEINGIARPAHKSTAIAVTRKRLEQYGAHRKVDAGVNIIDLEENGTPTGTRVVISTPFEG